MARERIFIVMARGRSDRSNLMTTQYEQQTLQYTVKLPVFEGPFELLLQLIEEQKVPIHEVSLSHLTEQYLAYLSLLQQSRLEIAGEFLVMAAFLIKLKSNSLLPQPASILDEVEEWAGLRGREDLLERLIEYKSFKERSKWLLAKKEVQDNIYFAPPLAVFEHRPLLVKNSEAKYLPEALARALKRYKSDRAPSAIRYERISLGQVMQSIWGKIKDFAQKFSFQGFIKDRQRLHVVVSFLAILELTRQGVIKVFQNDIFDQIFIESVPGQVPKISIEGEE